MVGAAENIFLVLRGITERDIYVMLLLFIFLVLRPGGLFGSAASQRSPPKAPGRKGSTPVMDFYLGLLQIIGVHTLLGLSAYVVLQTGQVSMAQAGFFAIGAYVGGHVHGAVRTAHLPAILIGAVLAGAMACLVGFPALRVKGLMLVVATLAFGEMVRLFFFNFTWQVERDGVMVGPLGAEGLPAHPLLPGERLDADRYHRLHLGHRHRGDAGAVVDGPLARRRGAARRGP
jgi:hypothetical protein